ncbi:MAG: glucose 1-dehydrogenase [Pseudomonadales bacterium]|nr:glucose 1-dehydrogenase [Pseudomonadales bacterium]MCP5172406.1 glucose 1-dehydrogenase [Pseudomonadales bacterium]
MTSNNTTLGGYNLKNRVAIVTGASSGIGFAIAEALYQAGASIVIADLEEAVIEKAASRLNDHERVRTFHGNLADEENAKQLVETATRAFGKLDILVNNAGGGVILPFLEHTAETLRQTLDRNLWTTLWCNKAALPVMKEQQYGRIIHIGADSVRNGLWDHSAYNAAKGGVHGLTTGLAREFATDGITVNTVAPCAVRTEIYDRILATQPDLIDKFVSIIPMGRAGECEEVASMVCYLASDQAAFVTGQVISVNGGSTML